MEFISRHMTAKIWPTQVISQMCRGKADLGKCASQHLSISKAIALLVCLCLSQDKGPEDVLCQTLHLFSLCCWLYLYYYCIVMVMYRCWFFISFVTCTINLSKVNAVQRKLLQGSKTLGIIERFIKCTLLQRLVTQWYLPHSHGVTNLIELYCA